MILKRYLVGTLLVLSALQAQAQTGATGIGTIAPASSAQLDVASTTKGMLIPRMTAAQRTAIPNPATGLQVYQTDGLTGLCYFDGGKWVSGAYGLPLNSNGNYVSASFVTTLAGSTYGDVDGTGSAAQFALMLGIATDAAGTVYVADQTNNKIRKITPAGVVTTLAGSSSGYADGTGTGAQFDYPTGVAVDGSGNVYVADRNNYKIRKITPGGVVSTLAGSSQGYADGTGSAAHFVFPTAVAVDGAGNVYVADLFDNKIRKVTPAGVVTTLAGSTYGYADGTGSAAQFDSPVGVAVDAAGNVYVADQGNSKVRKITPGGVVTTLAGSTYGYADGGATAKFAGLTGIATDASGNVYVAEDGNQKIRKISPQGLVTTLAGSTSGYLDTISTAAQFDSPAGIAVDAAGNVYVGDVFNNRVRKITTGKITAPAISGEQITNLQAANIEGTFPSIAVATSTTTNTLSATAATIATLDAAAWAAQSQTANGYAKMGGLIIQWGTLNYNASAAQTISYPIAFTNVFSVTATINANVSTVTATSAGANVPCKTMFINNTGFQVGGTSAFSGDTSTKVKWMAIGN